MRLEPVDYYADTNHQQLYALEHLYGVPQFVKSATVEGNEDLKNIPSESFGDPTRRKFPCHTKAATWLANAYFQLSRNAYSKEEQGMIQDRLEKRASYWSIRGIVDRFNTNFKKMAMPSENVADKDWGLIVTTDSGEVIRRFPMPNAISVKMAGEHLYANRMQYPYEWRKTAARKILAKAAEYDERAARGEKVAGVLLNQTRFTDEAERYLYRAAGLGMNHHLKVAEKVAQRVYMIGKNNPYAPKLAAVATTLRDRSNWTADELMKVAQILDGVDQECGLHSEYASGVDMPEEICFDVLAKDAEAILDDHIRLVTGNAYPIGLLATLPLEKISQVLGQEISDSVMATDGSVDLEKFAELCPTLPRPDALLLERMIDDVVKTGSVKEARAPLMAGAKFTKEELTDKLTKQGKKVETRDFALQYQAR